MEYHTVTPMNGEKCEICGEPATIVWVADEPETNTGYIDSLALCTEHEDYKLSE